MNFDPKQHLANGLEGWTESRRHRRVLRRALLAASVGLLLVAAFWMGVLFRQAGGLARLAGTAQSVAVSPADANVFRQMSFLPQAKRVPAPDYFLRTLDGQNQSLSQHEGKVVLLNFWATWCPPCIREMPSMQRLYEHFHAQGLEIVAISLDQGNPDAVREFVAKNKLSFPVLLDPDQTLRDAYRVQALPTTYLVDRKGRVVAHGMGSRDWDTPKAFQLVEQLIGEKS